MVAGKSPDWLPSGWEVQDKVDNGRKVKYFCNVETGQKFYSKKDVIRYVEMGNGSHSTPQPMNKRNKRRSENKPMPIVVKENGLPEWLPHGWIMEFKTRNSGSGIGRKYKCYIDPASGCKFFSKPEVSRYLKTHNIDGLTGDKSSSKTDVSQKRKTIKSKSSVSKRKKVGIGKHSRKNAVVESGSADGLPSGWIKEIKTRITVNGIQKDPYYTDPLSGYIFRSKKDVLRYIETGDIHTCAIKPKKRDINDLELINDDSSHNIDSLTGDKSSSKTDVSQNRKTIKSKSSVSKRKKVGIGKHSTKNVVVERGSADGLPPGWVKEIRTRITVNGIQKDPYYTDPLSGYIFRSKKDALRYIETGDILTCAIKPKKRDINDLELINDDISHNIDGLTGDKSSSKTDVSQNRKTIKSKSSLSKRKKVGIGKHSMKNAVVEMGSADGLPPGWIKEIKTRISVNGIQKDPYYTDPLSGYIFRSKKDALRYLETGDIGSCAMKPKKRDINDMELTNDISSPSAVDGKKLSPSATRRRLFKGKESGATGSLAAPKGESSKGNKAEILEIKHSLDDVNEKSSEPKTTKRKRGRPPVSSPATNILQEDKLPVFGITKHRTKRTQIDPSKSSNKRPLSPPGRSSKRLAGLKTEMSDNSGFSERLIRAAARKAPDAVAQGAAELLENEPEIETAHHVSISQETSPDMEPSNKSGKFVEDQAVPEEQPGRQEAEKHIDEKPEPQESQPSYPLAGSFPDPCLGFAFKAIPGGIPVAFKALTEGRPAEENSAIQGYFQQQVDSSHTQKSGLEAGDKEYHRKVN